MSSNKKSINKKMKTKPNVYKQSCLYIKPKKITFIERVKEWLKF